ncbi:MAG: hypothetical protein U0835_09905 [Isosphaeraceae bacterium]
MSIPPPPIRPRPRPRPKAPPRAPARRMPWGWLEVFAVSLTVLPAMLFLPGVSAVRPILRIASYLMGPFVWFMYSRNRNAELPGSPFTAASWLLFCVGWLVLSVAHPNAYSLITAVGQVALYVAVLSPAFWAGRLVDTPARIGRLIAILFLCNALSALVGVAQVHYPGRFDPPVIPALNNKFGGEDLKYETADGRRILRPCGLTDTPGGASSAGSAAAILGLCFALRPIGAFKRSACMGLAFIGLAAVYYSHVRSVLLMAVGCLGVLFIVLSMQRRYREASLLATGGFAVVVGGMLWAMRTVGTGVLKRFTVMFEGGDFVSYFNKMRGNYIHDALTRTLWENPLGYGMGWWGQIHGLFADPNRLSFVWVEVMVAAWVYDGGFPLLIGYGGAMLLALYDSGRVALTSRNPDLAFWAAVVLSLNVSIAMTSLSYVTFLAPQGMTFWLLAGAINGADRRANASELARRPARGFGFGGGRPRPRGAVAG